MPEKVTSLNGLKVTSEYWGYSIGALNTFYVKYQLITSLINYGLMYLSCRDSNEQCPSTLPDRDVLWSWRCCGAFYPVRVYRHSTDPTSLLLFNRI